MKLKEKVRSRAIFILLLVSFIILLLTNSVYADEGTIEYRGKITSGDSTVGEFYVDGRIAFCVDHAKPTPPNGTPIATKSVYSDPNIIKCLYYGWGGPGQWSGFTGKNHGIVLTSLALDHYMHNTNYTISKNFVSFLDTAPVPRADLNFSTTNFTASVQGDKQVTNSATISGNNDISLKFNIPDDVTIVCENRGWNRTGGEIIVTDGDIIHFEAPLTRTGNWTSEQIANSYVWNAILSETYNANLQRVIRLGEKDPGTHTSFSINFVDLGGLEVHKTDSQTGKAIANTEFIVTGPNGFRETKTTDSNRFF